MVTGRDAYSSPGAIKKRGRGASLPARPRVLAVLPGFIPSTTLTVVKPLTALHRAGQIIADITVEPWLSNRQIRNADLIVFSRNTEPYALDAVLAHGKPIIYDIDDNLFEIPATYASALAPERLAQFERYLRSADLIRAYSEPLRERVRQLNERALRVDCGVDWNLVPASPPPRDANRVRIVYATSRAQEDQLAALFMDDLRRLLRVYQHRVELFFWGYHPPELRGAPCVNFLDFIPDYDQFFRRFAAAGFDIGLAPLPDDIFHRSKCNNKFREYAACRIAGVYSDVDVYSSCVEDGRTGLLVGTGPGAWFEALSRLIEDAELRRNIQEQAFDLARTRYATGEFHAIWLRHIHETISGARRQAGGATKVRAEATGRPDNLRPSARPTLRARSFASFMSKLLRRLLRLAGKLGTAEGRTAAAQWLRLYSYSFRELLRVRRKLSPAARWKLWRRAGV